MLYYFLQLNTAYCISHSVDKLSVLKTTKHSSHCRITVVPHVEVVHLHTFPRRRTQTWAISNSSALWGPSLVLISGSIWKSRFGTCCNE